MRIDGTFKTAEHNKISFWAIGGIVSISALGYLDYLSGMEISLPFLYLIPIFLVTWKGNQGWGLMMSMLSTLTYLIVQSAAGAGSVATAIYFWNALIYSGTFVLATLLVTKLQKSHREELLAARTDFVTGVANSRYFNELLEREVERTRRYPQPFTVVYIDVDNFKRVNDLFGHSAGDEVLRRIARALKSQLRSTDIVARVGGDEFALLLPSTSQPEACVVISKVRSHLMKAVSLRSCPVTFSMGVLTYTFPPYSVSQLIDRADKLMYEVKNSTKDDIRFDTWAGEYAKS